MGLLVRASGEGIDHSVTRRVNCLEDLDGEVESMACGHTMHSECYHTYKEVKGIPLVADLPCPLCKQTENDMARKESQLLGGTMLDDPGSPLPWQDLSLDAQPHMPEPAVVAADANGQQPLPVDALVQQTAASGSAAPEVAAAGSAAADAQVPQSVVGLIHPEWAEPSVFCSTCGNMVSLSRTSILAKREGTWRCNKCRVKITALFRGFGTWPVHGFESIAEEEKRKFFADVQDKSGTECVAMARSLMCKYEEHHKFYEERGQFLPLSVWEKNGFPVDKIASDSASCDRKIHPILGECFRVALITTGSAGSLGMRFTQLKTQAIY